MAKTYEGMTPDQELMQRIWEGSGSDPYSPTKSPTTEVPIHGGEADREPESSKT